MNPALPREHSIGRVKHPDPMTVRGVDLVLLDGPLVDPIQRGYAPLGWEGDERLALYLHVPRCEWQLWRLEANGKYRLTAWRWADGDARSLVGLVPQLILGLVEKDSRRGYDVNVALDQADAAVEKAARQAQADLIAEVVPELAFHIRHSGVAD